MIGQDELMDVAGLKQKSALRRHLKKSGIPFKEINGNIWTTEEALTATLIGRARKKKQPNWSAIDE